MVPVKPEHIHTVFQSRREISNIIDSKSSKFLILVGPCSIHDVQACLEYANKLKNLSNKVEDKIMIVMRTYFEKPRTTKLLEGQSINYVTGPTFTLNRVSGSPIIEIGTDYTVSLRDQRVGAAATTAAGKEIGLARVYDFALESGSYNTSVHSENEWDIG